MRKEKQSFNHESLQDCNSIQEILIALADSIKQGQVEFSDEDDSIMMKAQGLLHLKLTASQEDGHNRFNIRVSWKDRSDEKPKNKTLKVS